MFARKGMSPRATRADHSNLRRLKPELQLSIDLCKFRKIA